jgi:hypothetical protein
VTSQRRTVGEIVIVGGGCYGAFYVRQLESARARGKLTYRRLLVVDHDPSCQVAGGPSAEDRELVVEEWGAFLDRYLEPTMSEDPGENFIVPSPLMPHLLFEWLLRQARARWPGRQIAPRPSPAAVGTPYETVAPDGTRYVSYADWLCPTHCVEPATCPIIRAPRTWEVAEAASDLTGRLARDAATAGPILFECRHLVYGVGAIPLRQVRAGAAILDQAASEADSVDLVVGTVSACHGALNLIHVPAESGGAGTSVQ